MDLTSPRRSNPLGPHLMCRLRLPGCPDPRLLDVMHGSCPSTAPNHPDISNFSPHFVGTLTLTIVVTHEFFIKRKPLLIVTTTTTHLLG